MSNVIPFLSKQQEQPKDKETLRGEFTRTYFDTQTQDLLVLGEYLSHLLGGKPDLETFRVWRTALISTIDYFKQMIAFPVALCERFSEFHYETRVDDYEVNGDTCFSMMLTLFKEEEGSFETVLHLELACYSPFSNPAFRMPNVTFKRVQPKVNVTCSDTKYQDDFTEMFHRFGRLLEMKGLYIEPYIRSVSTTRAVNTGAFLAKALCQVGRYGNDEMVYYYQTFSMALNDNYVKHSLTPGEPDVDSDPCGHSQNHD